MSPVTLLLLFLTFALGTSFLCSILEATLLSTREIDLANRAEDGDKGAALLLEIKRERVDDAISAILTLNTIAHTIGATMAGAQAAVIFGDEWMGVFSGILTLLVLVLTEIIPKTVGTVYATRIVGFVGRTIKILMLALTPVLFVTRLLTRLLTAGAHKHEVSKREVAALISLAAEQGTLRKEITRVLSNTLAFDSVRVEDIMTPRTVMWMMPADATGQDLIDDESHCSYSRLPVHGEGEDQIEGYVLIREVFVELAKGADRGEPLRNYMRDVHTIPEDTPVAEVLNRLLAWREHMAIAVNEFGGISGLVTLEDVLETILGQEILDEVDKHADMREVAIQLRDRRMQQRSLPSPDVESS